MPPLAPLCTSFRKKITPRPEKNYPFFRTQMTGHAFMLKQHILQK
ncbi:hypothetical protein DA2_2433 [Desulfovibrio sp. A2]|nr:hypothetical protein DA2_2433 [Desulfovibrio sp. A2]